MNFLQGPFDYGVIFSVFNFSCNMRFGKRAGFFHNTGFQHRRDCVASWTCTYLGKIAPTQVDFCCVGIFFTCWLCCHCKEPSACVKLLRLCAKIQPSFVPLAPSLPYSDALWSTSVLYTCIKPLYYTLLCLICTVKHTVPMAMMRLYTESLICLPDGFLTLTGSLPWVGLTCLVDLMSEQQMFTAFWKRSISDPIPRSTV